MHHFFFPFSFFFFRLFVWLCVKPSLPLHRMKMNAFACFFFLSLFVKCFSSLSNGEKKYREKKEDPNKFIEELKSCKEKLSVCICMWECKTVHEECNRWLKDTKKGEKKHGFFVHGSCVYIMHCVCADLSINKFHLHYKNRLSTYALFLFSLAWHDATFSLLTTAPFSILISSCFFFHFSGVYVMLFVAFVFEVELVIRFNSSSTALLPIEWLIFIVVRWMWVHIAHNNSQIHGCIFNFTHTHTPSQQHFYNTIHRNSNRVHTYDCDCFRIGARFFCCCCLLC